MTDLLGDEITPRPLLDPMHGFVEFWKAWPRCDRKVGKPQAKAKWIKLGCANNSGHIIKHVEYLKTTEQWIGGFVPQPCTYLNQCRWLDWEPEPEKPKHTICPALAKILADDKKAVPMPESMRRMR